MNALKNIIRVAMSNITTILSGIVVGFLVPKVLSLSGYGYYKTFTLYVSYLGLFSLGIVDGIVLKYGDKDYDALERNRFRAYFLWYMLMHICMALMMLVAAFLMPNKDMKIITVMLGMNLIAVNVTGYFQHISQITQRFKEYSYRKVIQSILNVTIVVLMYIVFKQGYQIDYNWYVLSIVIMNYLLMAWYIYTYRDIVFGKRLRLEESYRNVVDLIKLGFPLLFANLCSTLLLTIDRQFVNFTFNTEDYAIYAFAYNMLSLVTVATSAISTVLYPMLKRAESDNVAEKYPYLVGIVMIVVYALMLAYFPLVLFVNWFLPKYSMSLDIFRIILPGIAISSTVTVVMHNYYKAIGRNKEYFAKSVVILTLSVVANAAAYFLFGTMGSISIASIFTIVVWYILVDYRLSIRFKQERTKNLLYGMSMMFVFYICSAIPNVFIGAASYCLVFILVSLLLYKDLLIFVRKWIGK